MSTKATQITSYVQQLEIDQSAGLARRAYEGARSGIEGTIIGLEVTPANEVLRGIVFAIASAKIEHNPFAVGATYGLATGVIEGLAVVSTADVLERGGAPLTRRFIDKGLNKVGLEAGARVHGLVKAGVAFLGGSAISTLLRDREDPTDRTRMENLKYGMGVAGILSFVCGAQGYLLDQGIDTPSLPTIGGAILGVASIPAVFAWAKSKIDQANEEVA